MVLLKPTIYQGQGTLTMSNADMRQALLVLVTTKYGIDPTTLDILDHAATYRLEDTDATISAVLDAVRHIIAVVGPPLRAVESPFGKSSRRAPQPEITLLLSFEGGVLISLLAQVRMWVSARLISYTDAAHILYPDFETLDIDTATSRIRRLVEQNRLRGFDDPFTINPRWAKRVRRAAVEHLAATRTTDPNTPSAPDNA